MRATTSLIFTPTGQSTMQAGLAQAMQRVASVRASAASKPRVTSSKLRQRISGASSGMCLRMIFMRSLSGRIFMAERGRAFLSGMDHVLSGQLFSSQFFAQFCHFFFFRCQFGAKLGEFLILVLFEMLERLALLAAIH